LSIRSSLDYLEQAKVEELADSYREQGYDVRVEGDEHDRAFDLVARKGGRTIAVEVKAQARLKDFAGQLARLRKIAKDRGYSEFRVNVVNPPHQVSVEIQDLARQLKEYLAQHFPVDSGRGAITGVFGIQFDELEIRRAGIQARGSGVILLTLSSDPGKDADTISGEAEVSFQFDVLLDHELRIQEVRSIRLDAPDLFNEQLATN